MMNPAIGLALATALFGTASAVAEPAQPQPSSIPFSSIASPEARRAWEEQQAIAANWPLLEKYRRLAQMTAQERQAFYRESRALQDVVQGPKLAAQRARYKVENRPATIGGVYTETFTPGAGVAPRNANRVLINLHAGGFTVGAPINGRIESIPIAAVARMKVISVDYRMAPEHRFPAATEDVLAVYRELLKTYEPGNIGIYGCSAGGTLAAQVIATIIARKLPRPGAIGMFCGTGDIWAKGDSAYFSALLRGAPPQSAEHDPTTYEYLRGVDVDNPLIFPMRYPETLRAFPPSLLISGSRAMEMSTLAQANNKLAAAGVETGFHIWDGVGHAFLHDPDLPESREAYDVIARFFDEKLGPWYRRELQDFVAADLSSGLRQCSILFIGSSSIKFWDSLGRDMAPAPVLNRGFGGSTIRDINDVFDHVVTPYWPKAIFFYAGENDISDDASSPLQVLAAFTRFMEKKSARLGPVPVYFLSIKPSKLRWSDLAKQREANRLIRDLAGRRSDLQYVDVAAEMVVDGEPRDIFADDKLHMTAEGYRLWAAKLRPLVLRETARTEPGCGAASEKAPLRVEMVN